MAASPGNNTPFWSLAYEVWYYIFLGLRLFVTSLRRRVLLLLLAAFVAGQKILVTLPVWKLGVFSYQSPQRLTPRLLLSILLLALTSSFLGAILSGQATIWGCHGNWQAKPPLYFYTAYLADLSIHIIAVDQLMKH